MTYEAPLIICSMTFALCLFSKPLTNNPTLPFLVALSFGSELQLDRNVLVLLLGVSECEFNERGSAALFNAIP
jgi:hypothetical protein